MTDASSTDFEPTAGLSHADLSNWRERPHSTWAFRNVRALMPCADVPNAPDRVQALPDRPASLDAFQLRTRDGGALDLDQFLRATCTDGFVVLHDGHVVCERYDGGLTPHAPHILMSATKSVVGLVVGVLAGNGGLDVDATVGAIAPELASTAFGNATLRQLLDMRTGVVIDGEALDAYRAATGWEPVRPGEAPADLANFFRQGAATHGAHGGPFRYVSANTDLLGLLIERVTGRPFATLASELLWQPMGAEDGAFITVDSRGAPRCTGGFCATARDLARVGQLVADDGRCGSRDVVPASWLEDIRQHADRAAWDQGEFAAGFAGLPMHYRSGWYAIDGAVQTLFAMGIHGQHLFVDRANRLVVAKLSSQALPIDPVAMQLTLRAVQELRRCLQT
ncbi:MAG: serine hydrolase [Pseudomonadota bacterium]